MKRDNIKKLIYGSIHEDKIEEISVVETDVKVFLHSDSYVMYDELQSLHHKGFTVWYVRVQGNAPVIELEVPNLE